MRGEWELLATRRGATVTSLVTCGAEVVATTPAGLRHSTDGGHTWAVLGSARMPSMELGVPSPAFASDGTLLVGTADGLLRSADRGRSWQQVLVGSRVLAIVFAPAGTDAPAGLVFVGTADDGILRSTDSGRTWTSANPGLLELTVLGLACSPAFDVDHTLFAATASGLFRSSNAGRAWRALETVPDEPAVQCVALSPRFSTDAVGLAGTEADGLLRSTDGGNSWRAVPAFDGRAVTALAWSSSGSLAAAATDTGVMASDDAGATWWQVGTERGPVLSVAFASDGCLLAGVPRHGILRCRDLHRWEQADAGLQANLVVALALSPEFARDRTLYIGGLEDGVAASTDGGTTWEDVDAWPRGDEPPAVFGLATGPRGIYAATSAGLLFGGRTHGYGWSQLHADAARAVRTSGQHVVALDTSGTLLASMDGGTAWRSLAWPPSAGQPVSVALADPATILVGSVLPSTSQVAVWRTVDGQVWQRVLLESGRGRDGDTLPLAVPSTHAIDSLVYVGLGDAVARAAHAVDEGVKDERPPAWRRVQLPGTVSALESSPAYGKDHTLLAASSAGVYRSRDAGATFHPVGEALAKSPVLAVAFSPAYAEDRLIYAVELGGRIWRLRDAP